MVTTKVGLLTLHNHSLTQQQQGVYTTRNINGLRWTILPSILKIISHDFFPTAQAWDIESTDLSSFLGYNSPRLPEDHMPHHRSATPTLNSEDEDGEFVIPQTDFKPIKETRYVQETH